MSIEQPGRSGDGRSGDDWARTWRPLLAGMGSCTDLSGQALYRYLRAGTLEQRARRNTLVARGQMLGLLTAIGLLLIGLALVLRDHPVGAGPAALAVLINPAAFVLAFTTERPTTLRIGGVGGGVLAVATAAAVLSVLFD